MAIAARKNPSYRRLLGKPLARLYDPTQTPHDRCSATARCRCGTLRARSLGKPAYELLGGKGPEPIKVYDGSIYFADLLPENAEKPLDRFKEEIDMGLRIGHRAFKIKLGRGAKWMERKAGDERDSPY